MRLVKVLDNVNQFEKNSFIKIISDYVSESKQIEKQVEQITSDSALNIKNADSVHISEVFQLVASSYKKHLETELSYRKHLDIVIDILIKDGNCMMSRDWFSRLYEKKYKILKTKLKGFNDGLEEESKTFDESRKRDYTIFKNCVEIAYFNDEGKNRDPQINRDEQSILNVLANSLELSLEEVRLIRFSTVPLEKLNIDDILKDLKDIGVLFYSKKNLSLYVPDEIVTILREIRGFEVSNKYYRRVLINLKDSEINLICGKHNIDKKLTREEKISEIINEGISFRTLLLTSIFKENTSKTDQKAKLAELIEKKLSIEFKNKGSKASDKVDMLIDYFRNLEKDKSLFISMDAYSTLLRDLDSVLPKLKKTIKVEFELEEDEVLNRDFLIDYNIKPQDILDLISKEDLITFCQAKELKSRGNIVQNIIEAYQDTSDLLLENYVLVGKRDINTLKEQGIAIKESDLGVQFEELTKIIFTKLGLNVDEELRQQINTSRDKADIVINLGNNQVIIVECKTHKDKEFNKFSTVSRQIRAYFNQAEKSGYKVVKTLLVADDFTDDFISGSELDFEIGLSLLKSKSLIKILEGFKESKLNVFPYKLLFRDVVLNEERIVKSLKN